MNLKVTGHFWGPRLERTRTVTLPVEYEQNRKTGALEAYQWEWDPAKPPRPWRIWVGDVGKWIEAASYSLAAHPDPELLQTVENAVQGILKGQKADGYLYANPMAPDQRWTNLQELHEHYDVGHTIEGAVAYYETTGRREFLDALCRCADLLDRNFGPEEGKKRGYDGHPEVELALVKLYRATGERRYLNLAKFFVDERGRKPNYFDQEKEEAKKQNRPLKGWISDYRYVQAHQPVREQKDAVGHAVRAMYLYSGMADVAVETGDRGLLAACKRLWKSATHRQMYVIGGVGSTSHGEAFTFDYDLPNETAYAETCANIALVFFAHRMLQIEADSEYADVMERALYNGVLSGISLDGKRFFYANHLTVCPRASKSASGHVAGTRQEWFGCACCPPNIARLLTGLGQYVCSTARDGVYVHLYVGGDSEFTIRGKRVSLKQETEYPWKEQVGITVEPESPFRFTVALRIPGWCRGAKLSVNGKPLAVASATRKGYACIRRVWQKGDRIELTLPMPVERIEANPEVRMDCGKLALQRGPVVYCLEEADNGPHLADIFLPRSSRLTAEFRPMLLGGVVVIRGKAQRRDEAGWGGKLYRPQSSKTRPADIMAVPYYAWANRRPGEMLVWIRGD
jgi:DUF1680 family protein